MKKNREAVVNEEGVLYNDLCLTCNYIKICTGKENRQGAVWFCEEFDDHVPVMEQESGEKELQIIPPWNGSNPEETGSVQFKGLCINCENRKTCSKSRVAGGIWHCEEYC